MFGILGEYYELKLLRLGFLLLKRIATTLVSKKIIEQRQTVPSLAFGRPVQFEKKIRRRQNVSNAKAVRHT